MVFLEGHQDVAIRGAHGPRVVVRSVDAAVRQSKVIYDFAQLIGRNDLANHLLDFVRCPGRFFNARAGCHADVHVETAGIHGREEILPEEGEQKTRCQDKSHHNEDDLPDIVQTQAEQIGIALPKILEAPFESAHVCLHFTGRNPREIEDHRHHRNVDIWENIPLASSECREHR